MGENSKNKETVYYFEFLEGTPYEIGVLQGNRVKSNPMKKEFFSSKNLSKDEFQNIHRIFDRYFPEMNEEMKGFSDAAEIPMDKIIFYPHSYLFQNKQSQGFCSHFAILPKATKNQNVLAGRSYEYGDEVNDNLLCHTRVRGKYKHIGFSSLLFGRMDGMNDQGLSVSLSASGFPVGYVQGMTPPPGNGFQHWVVLRKILEECKGVNEALKLFEKIPLGTNVNFILADGTGKALLVEAAGMHIDFKRIDGSSPKPYICSTNHPVLEKTQPSISSTLENSYKRIELIQDKFGSSMPHIDQNVIKELLSTEYPGGLCCHHYEDYFGTLYSMIFDLTEKSIQICFGSPRINGWKSFDFSSVRPEKITSILPLKKADPDFFKMRKRD